MTGGGLYAQGDEVTLTVSDAEGYRFMGWYDNSGNKLLGDKLTLELTAEKSMDITAVFTKPVVTIDNGTSIKTIETDYNEPLDILLLETPTREGYTFNGWYIGDETYNFNEPVTVNIVLVARWLKDPKEITTDNEDETKGTVEGLGMYAEGAAVTLTAIPESGYAFKSWTDANGDEVSAENPYIFAMGGEDLKLNANFVKVVTDITLTSASQIKVNSEYTPSANVTPTDAENTFVTWSLISAPDGTVFEDGKVKTGENAGFVTLRATIEGGKGNEDFKKDFSIEVMGEKPMVYYYQLYTDGKWKVTQSLTDTITGETYTPKTIENYTLAGYSVNEYKDEQYRTKTEEKIIQVQEGTESHYLYYVPKKYEDGILFTGNNEQLAISSSKEGTCSVIFAAYKDNALISCKMTDKVNVKNGIQVTNVPSGLNTDDADTIKAFLWKDIGGLVPVCDETSYKK